MRTVIQYWNRDVSLRRSKSTVSTSSSATNRRCPPRDTWLGLQTIATAGLSLAGAATSIIFVVTKVLLWQTRVCRDKHCWKSHHSTKIFWKATVPFLTFHCCPKSLKKSFSTNFSPIPQENNLSNPFQSAYRAGHSTETVLLRIVNDILSALDNDNISVLLLLDLSAAFDTIDHQILLSRLNSVFGIQSTALQ